MLRSNVLILAAHERQEAALQIRHLLELETDYKVELVCGTLHHGQVVHVVPPQLLIAVVPNTKHEAVVFLRQLHSLDVRTSLLTVLSPDMMNNDGLEKSQDFVVTPLHEAEVLTRVRRLIETSHRSVAIRQATQACNLAQLHGEDPKTERREGQETARRSFGDWTAVFLWSREEAKQGHKKAARSLSAQ